MKLIIKFLHILLIAVGSCFAAYFMKEPALTTAAFINGSAKIDCIIVGHVYTVPIWKINGTQYYQLARTKFPAGAISESDGLLIDPVSIAWNNTSFQCRLPGIISNIGYLFVYYQEVDLTLIGSSSTKDVTSSSLAVPLPNKSSYGFMLTDTEPEVSSLKYSSLHYDQLPTSVDYEQSISSSYMYSMSEGSLNFEIEQTQKTNSVDMRFLYVVTPVLVTGTCLFIVVTLGISLRCYYIKKVRKKNSTSTSNEEHAISRDEPLLSSIQRDEAYRNPAYGMVERRTGIMCINQAYGLVTGYNDESRLKHNPAYGVIRL